VYALPRLSVLVVDDYPDAADSLADLIRLYGHPHSRLQYQIRGRIPSARALRLRAGTPPRGPADSGDRNSSPITPIL